MLFYCLIIRESWCLRSRNVHRNLSWNLPLHLALHVHWASHSHNIGTKHPCWDSLLHLLLHTCRYLLHALLLHYSRLHHVTSTHWWVLLLLVRVSLLKSSWPTSSLPGVILSWGSLLLKLALAAHWHATLSWLANERLRHSHPSLGLGKWSRMVRWW